MYGSEDWGGEAGPVGLGARGDCSAAAAAVAGEATGAGVDTVDAAG